MIRIRPFAASDRAFVLSLAPRLVIGISDWRDPAKMLVTARKWLTASMARHGTKTMIFVAEDEQGERLGCVSVSHDQHFTGEGQAYIGELAVSEDAEGQKVGQALVVACEQWAREQGYPFLVLATGTANTHARGFYQHLGFLEEDVKLVKLL
ncbi:MAG: GNAT family N-acetyltransferase [Ktedonobacteraceae bacterium]|nr:GNAT family N-acetyltransferase [Chloroflexota bacterium]